MRRLLFLVPALLLETSCSTTPPARWVPGGARLALTDATWQFDGADVRLQSDGQVTVDGSSVFSIDTAGRVYDDDGDPAALLLPDGNVAGTDETYLGRVGITNASPPGSANAWVSLTPDGMVTIYDSDGSRHAAGRWAGCKGAALRSCTFVTHLVVLGRVAAAQWSGMSFGVGVGVYH